MTKEELLNSYEAADLNAVINNYSYMNDDQVVISVNNVDLTLGDLKAEYNKKTGGQVEQPVEEQKQSKEDLLNSYTDEQLKSIVDNYTYLNDDQVALSINNIDLTAGELRAEQAKRNPQVEEQTNPKEDLLNSYTDEQIESIVNNYTYLNDDQVALSINNVDLTAGELRAEQAKRNPQVEEQQPIETTIVDDNPQHEANPETGYAVGGFQSPAVVEPQQFEAPAVIEEPTEVQETPFLDQDVSETKSVSRPDAAQVADAVMAIYNGAGYMKNAFGQYFNPNTDEYDETYDPHQDPMFNEPQQQEATQVAQEENNNHRQLFSDYANICNEMGNLLGIEPFPGIENEQPFSIQYQLDDNEVEKFNDLKDQLMLINAKDSEVAKDYFDLMTEIKSIRTEMGAILNKPPYPGIENEPYHDIAYQLDDNEKDSFAEGKEKLDAMKKDYPELFANLQKTKDLPTPETAPQEETGTDELAEEEEQEVEQEKPEEEQTEEEVDDLDEDPEEIQLTPTQEELLIQREKRKKIIKIALAGAVGFAAGVGLSCVPGVGQIRMALAATKLVGAGINFWANRHPDGKIAKARDWVREQWYDKCPNFARGVDYIKAKMKQVPYNAFINGMSLGYITGNVFELMTGQTVFQAIGEKMNGAPAEALTTSASNTPQITDNSANTITENPIVDNTQVTDATSVVESTPVVPPTPTPDQITEIVKSGQSVDISGIEMGRVSSDAQNAVRLLQSRGSDVTFLREVTLNDGTKMWAFNQANGAGYAWFKADDIINYLGENSPEIVAGVSR